MRNRPSGKKYVYAAKTTVPASRTMEEIWELLRKRGASSYHMTQSEHGSALTFVYEGWRILLSIPAHDCTPQEYKARWRAMLLAIRAKMAMIDCGASDFTNEFYGSILLNQGQTVREATEPMVREAMTQLPDSTTTIIEAHVVPLGNGHDA